MTIPSEVRGYKVVKVGKYAFADAKINTLILPESILVIDDYGLAGSYIPDMQLPKSITHIKECAFVDIIAHKLCDLDFPNVVEVGQNAFNTFRSLRSISLPLVDSIPVGAFFECAHLTSVKLSPRLKRIESSAFSWCYELETIDIPSTVTEIGSSAFWKCSSLKSINLPPNLEQVSDDLFAESGLESIVIPSGYKSIGRTAFQNCKRLKQVTLSGTLELIGDAAFAGCDSLETILIPSGVNFMGVGAFENCTSLKEVTLPTSIDVISEGAFQNCASLSSIHLPPNIESIGNYAFRECSNLSNVSLPEGLQKFGRNVFTGCKSLTGINLPSSVTDLSNAFVESGLKSISIPDGVTSLYGTFSNCTALKSVDLNNVEELLDYTFTGCTALKSLAIGPKLRSLREYFAFGGGLNLEYITVDSRNVVYDSRNNCNALIETKSNRMILGTENTVIPDGVVSIPHIVFDGVGIKEIVLPNSVTNINLRNCPELTSLTIGSGIQDFNTDGSNNYNALNIVNCPKLSVLRVVADNPVINSNGNCNAVMETATNKLLFGCLSTVIPANTTEIGRNAFNGSQIQSVHIGSGIKTIGVYAFQNCLQLETVTIDDGLRSINDCAFLNCRELNSIQLPESLEDIGFQAFRYCTSLTTVTLPSKIGGLSESFLDCTKLTTVYCRNTEPSEVWRPFEYNMDGGMYHGPHHSMNLYVPKGTLQKYLSTEGWSANYIEILVDGNSEGEYAVGDKFKIKTEEGVDVLYTVTDVLTKSVVVGDNRNSAIGDFSSMPEGFTGTITLPDEVNGYRVTAISDKAFQGKKFLRFINMPEGLDSIGVEAFQGSVLHEIHFPSTLTKLGRRAFADCQNMSGVPVIPDGVKDIPDECFANCTSLWSPSLPHTLERIGRRAFWNIMGGHMFFPATLKNVGEEAYFGFMDGYATIQYRSAAMEPVEIPENAIAWMITPEQLQEFWMQDQAPGLYVPKGSLEAYKTTKGWSKFWPGIYELDNIDKCTVTYVLNGKEYQQVTVGYGREYEPDLLPDVPQGYEFSGWTWDTGATGALLVRQDHKVSGIFTTEESQQMVKTLNLYGTDGEPCGTMDVNFLLTTDDNNHNSAIVYKPRAYVDMAEVMTDGIPAFSNVTGEAGVLALPDAIEDEAGVVYTVDSIGSCAFYGCGELLGIDFGNSVQAIGTQAFQRSALQGMLTIPTNVHRIGIQAFTNTKGVTKAVFQHRQPNEIWWGVGNKDDFAGPQQTVLEVCQGIIDECSGAVRGDNFIYWYAENSQSMKNSFSNHIPNQLKLNGEVVTMANGSDILGNGTARYNAITRTLTLAGCEAEELRTTLIDGLTVMLVGDNQLQSVNAYRSALTVMSDEASEGRLTVKGTVKLDRSDMTVKDCQRVEVNDEEYGLYTPWHKDLEARLTVDNSVLYVGKLRGFTDLHLENVSLPQNAIFAAATDKGMHESKAMVNLFQVWHNQVYELSSATIQYYEPPVQDEVGVTIQTDFAALFDGEETDKTPYNNEYNGVLYHLYREASEKDLDTWWWGGKSPVVNYYKDGALYLSTLMTDEQMETIAAADNLNTDEFRAYNGLVVHVSQGNGIIIIDCATRPGHVLKVKAGAQEPVVIQTDVRQTIEVPYQTKQDCYIYIYVANADNVSEASRRMIAARRSAVEFPDETVAQLFGLSLTVESVSGVKSVILDAADGTSRWYDLQGRRVIKPTKEGLYIRNGRKVIVK